MHSPRLARISGALLSAAAIVALSACGNETARGGAFASTPSTPMVSLAKASGHVIASPATMNFTTVPGLKLQIKESGYSGTFKLAVSPGNLVKLSTKSPKGPSAKLTVTASNAGKGMITVSDSSGNKATVTVTVSQSVIIIQ